MMAIGRAGTFEYVAIVDQECIGAGKALLHCVDRSDSQEPSLLGPAPRIILAQDRFTMEASGRRNASIWKASFSGDNRLLCFFQEGDSLSVARNSCGSIGVSLLRKNNLVYAFGAPDVVPLGSDVAVFCNSEILSENAPVEQSGSEQERYRFEFTAGDEKCQLRTREAGCIGGLYIYVERCWRHRVPNDEGCIAIATESIPGLRDAAVRSAILLGNTEFTMLEWGSSLGSNGPDNPWWAFWR